MSIFYLATWNPNLTIVLFTPFCIIISLYVFALFVVNNAKTKTVLIQTASILSSFVAMLALTSTLFVWSDNPRDIQIFHAYYMMICIPIGIFYLLLGIFGPFILQKSKRNKK